MLVDADSFAAFVRQNSRSLYGTAYMLTGNANAAEELLQDTLVRLYPKWAAVESADSALAYVRRAVINGFLSTKRRPAAVGYSDGAASGYAPDVADAVTDRHVIVELLADLPERQRAAIVLHCLYDLPDAEIAAVLECRTATVRSLVSRGIATMRARQLRTSSVGAAGMEEQR